MQPCPANSLSGRFTVAQADTSPGSMVGVGVGVEVALGVDGIGAKVGVGVDVSVGVAAIDVLIGNGVTGAGILPEPKLENTVAADIRTAAIN